MGVGAGADGEGVLCAMNVDLKDTHFRFHCYRILFTVS